MIEAHRKGYWIWEVPGLQLGPDGDYPPREEVDPIYWTRRADDLPSAVPARIAVTTGLALLQGIGRVLWPKLEEITPPSVRALWKVRRGVFGVPVEVSYPDGTVIRFGSGEQDPMQYEGQDNDLALFDEPPPRPIFSAAWRGMTDRMGRVAFSMTPWGPNARWVYEEFVASGRDDVVVVTGSIHENPYISAQAKQEFLDGGGFTSEERAARENGTWTFLSHLAFPTYRPDVHLIPPYKIPSGWIRGMAVDPGHRRPYAMTWAAFGPNGEMVPYREWPSEDHGKMRSSSMTIHEYADLIRRLEKGERIDFRLLDPRFGKATQYLKGQAHTSIQDDFAEQGLFFDCNIEGTEREETGIERIRELLRYDTSVPLSELNRPKLRIFNNLHNTIQAIQYSNFVPPAARDPDVLPEKLLEKWKDHRDCLRYLAMHPTAGMTVEDEHDGYIAQRDWDRENTDGWGL